MRRIQDWLTNVDLWLYTAFVLILIGVVTVTVWRAENLSSEPIPPPPTARPTQLAIAAEPAHTNTPVIESTAEPTLPASQTPQPSLTLTPTTVEITPEPTPEPIGILFHDVTTGETLDAILQQYDITLDALAAFNDQARLIPLRVGQRLVIPLRPAQVEQIRIEATPEITPPGRTDQGIQAVAIAPPDRTLNGLPLTQFVILPEDTRTTVRQIYQTGQSLGRNSAAFSKLGDSTIENPYFLAPFDRENYTLGDYSYLQPVIQYFTGSHERDSIAVRVGLHTWSVMDPMWAGGPCEPGEHMLTCEFRLHNPAFLFIRLGSNDAGVPRSVERSLREIIEYCIAQGVVPILGTKADRFEGPANTNNEIIRKLADEYNVPLWDYDLVAATIPGRGLTGDRVHMTNFSPADYTRPEAFRRGHPVHNLSALMMLDALLPVVSGQP